MKASRFYLVGALVLAVALAWTSATPQVVDASEFAITGAGCGSGGSPNCDGIGSAIPCSEAIGGACYGGIVRYCSSGVWDWGYCHVLGYPCEGENWCERIASNWCYD